MIAHLHKIELFPKRPDRPDVGGELIPTPAIISACYCSENGEFVRRTIKVDGGTDVSSEPPEVKAAAESALAIPEDTDLQRIDFECGKIRNPQGEWVYSDKAFQIRAGTKDKLHGWAVAPLCKCPNTGNLIETDVDSSELPDELKQACKKLFACEGVKEGFREVAEKHLAKQAARQAAREKARQALIDDLKAEIRADMESE